MQDIVTAARTVFTAKGYRRTQVADVAKEVGISPAALYRHVESKDALFHLCFVDEVPGVDTFVTTPREGATVDLIRTQLRRATVGSTLRRAIRQPADDWVAELTVIVTELYRTLQRSQELMTIVEASAGDREDLDDFYFRRRRGGYTQQLARYLELGVEAGAFRPIAHPDIVALQLREACAWFAWHRHGDPDAPDIDDDDALDSIIDIYVRGLVA
jgi:AcrR family transcriptional regulator